jgi:uncharacterized protein (TIGR02145 family)
MAAAAAERPSAVDDVVARPGESEVIIENRLSVPLRIFVGGRSTGVVRARGTERLVVADGSHTISVQSSDRSGGISRDVRFHAHSQRVYFRATSPNPTTVSLTRERSYAIAPVGRDGRGVGVASAGLQQGGGRGVAPSATTQRQGGQGVAPTGQQRRGRGVGISVDDFEDDFYDAAVDADANDAAAATVADVAVDTPADDGERPIAETALGQDRAAMFERLDAAVGAGALAPAATPEPTPAAPAVAAVPIPAPDAFTDPRDGRTYRTVRIGNLTWMAENLDGLYTWYYTVGETGEEDGQPTLCPAPWRVPNNDDWNSLVQAAGGAEAAVKKLKSRTGWAAGGNGTDNFGFSALPGSYSLNNGFATGEEDIVEEGGVCGRWWSAVGIGTMASYSWSVCRSTQEQPNVRVVGGGSYVGNLLSVRCVRD